MFRSVVHVRMVSSRTDLVWYANPVIKNVLNVMIRHLIVVNVEVKWIYLPQLVNVLRDFIIMNSHGIVKVISLI
jgi:hypothetical protein